MSKKLILGILFLLFLSFSAYNTPPITTLLAFPSKLCKGSMQRFIKRPQKNPSVPQGVLKANYQR
ncbi:hypothetical protein [Thermococcus sp. Bubb.Bath]|uniref:hypothetical protein n=1 Tax=Thermococcus sp. Bubb.Bath TaxID=1638242 RepID=UPI001438E947|nr:hypothetical protein [Thermococcus sp. Bubb.Bath]NJF25512.1 hypothetical protein [Thermococcus sp. Bubb.Bath]